MSSREKIVNSKEPRTAALNYVTENGKHTLKVDEFIPAARPSGNDAHSSSVTGRATGDYAPGIKGIRGTVNETGQSYTIRDDYDFAAGSGGGKGYHVNAQLGKETNAFVSGRNSQEEYFQRTDMTGERLYYDGHEEAARFYTQGHSR